VELLNEWWQFAWTNGLIPFLESFPAFEDGGREMNGVFLWFLTGLPIVGALLITWRILRPITAENEPPEIAVKMVEWNVNPQSAHLSFYVWYWGRYARDGCTYFLKSFMMWLAILVGGIMSLAILLIAAAIVCQIFMAFPGIVRGIPSALSDLAIAVTTSVAVRWIVVWAVLGWLALGLWESRLGRFLRMKIKAFKERRCLILGYRVRA